MGFVKYISGGRGPSGFGSASTAEQVAEGIRLDSQVAIVTGSTSGIGFETARVLAKHGAHVVVPARKIKDSERVRSKIIQEFPDATLTVGELDLSSLSSVEKFAQEFQALKLPLNILINNAGIQSNCFVLSPDGLELDFATNHMGHFFLVELLLEDMIKTSNETGIEGRVISVASEAHQIPPFRCGIDFEKLNDEKSFNWAKAYGRSKLANILHAKALAKRLEARKVNVTANALHPGAIKTNLGREHNQMFASMFFFCARPFFKNIPQVSSFEVFTFKVFVFLHGTATTIYAAVHPSMRGVSGKYLVDCNEANGNSYANDMELAERLWKYSEEFVTNRK